MEQIPEITPRDLFVESLKAFKNILNGISYFDYKEIKKGFCIDFFDDELNFYSKHLNNMNETIFSFRPIESLSHELNQRNMVKLLDYIEQLSQINENIYKEPLIKLNLSLIFNYFTNRFGKKFIDTQEYFYLCLKELEKKYVIKSNSEETNFDKSWREKAKNCLKGMVDLIHTNISKIYSKVLTHYKEIGNFDEYSKILRILREFREQKDNLSIEQLKTKYILNPLYKEYIDYYFNSQCEEYISDKKLFEVKKRELCQRLFLEDIMEANINNIEESLFLIYVEKQMNNGQQDINTIYMEYKNYYISIYEESKEDLTNELSIILDKEIFFENLLSILESNFIKNYFENKRLFNKSDNNIILTFDNYFDDDLSREYKFLLDNMKKNKNYLKDLIFFKYLPKYKRAIVNPLMRIIINPLYIKISDPLKNDESKKEEILKAYLITILIHKIIYLFKFFKETFSFKNIPKTQESEERVEVFIKYLFGSAKVKNLGYEQAKMINNLNNWNDINLLHKIYENCDEKDIKQEKIETYDNSKYYISFYDTDMLENEESLKKEVYEIGDWCNY